MTPSMEPTSAMARSRSLHSRFLKPRLTAVSSSLRKAMTGAHPDDVRDGQLFHIRVTVGYLTSLRMADAEDATRSKSQEAEPLVTAYVSFGLLDGDRGEYDCATSCPLTPGVSRQNVKWPKGTDVKTSKRRLYFSVLLRSDDSAAAPAGSPTFDDDDSTSFRAPSEYAPEFLNLFIGLKCGDETIVLAAATLVMTGEQVTNQQIDLPVRRVSIVTGKKTLKQGVFKDSKPGWRKSGLKGLFGANTKSDDLGSVQTAMTKGSYFARCNKVFSCDKNSVLQIKLDVMEGLYQTNGPALWGDLEDDEESFGPVPVIDIPHDCTDDLTERYKHEAIEVFAFKRGTTIISTPGHGEAEEQRPKQVSLNLPSKKNRQPLDELLAAPAVANQHFLFCGQDTDVISEMPMTSSVTEADDDSLSSNTDSDSSSNLSSIPESLTMNTLSRGTLSQNESIIQDFKGSEEGFEESTAGEDPSGTGDTYDDGTDTDGESALEETEAASNVLLRYASRLVLPLDALLAEDGSSHGSTSYGGSSKGTGTIEYLGSARYPGDRSRESAYFSGDQSTYSGGDRSESLDTARSTTSRLQGWFR